MELNGSCSFRRLGIPTEDFFASRRKTALIIALYVRDRVVVTKTRRSCIPRCTKRLGTRYPGQYRAPLGRRAGEQKVERCEEGTEYCCNRFREVTSQLAGMFSAAP